MTRIRATIRRALGGATRIGIGISLGEIRLLGVNHAGHPVWCRSFSRGRADQSLTELVAKALAERPASLRGRLRVACVVGPTEAQLRPLHGLPALRSASEQLAVVAESLDRFFVSAGARMRISSPVHVRGGEIWAAAVERSVVRDLALACREQRVRLVGVTPVAAALGHLVDPRRASEGETPESGAHVHRSDDGTSLHVLYDPAGMPSSIRRERAPVGLPTLGGAVRLPAPVDPVFGDAYAATRLRAGDPFIIGEHSDEMRRATLARRRTALWIGIAAAGLVAAAWAPGALASRRAQRARTRLAALSTKQRELQKVQLALAASTASLNGIADFERSRRSATLLLAELAMALPDSTAVTAFHVDSLGGTLTLLAPKAAAALEAVSDISLMGRVQMSGPVTREITAGVELERASLRFAFTRAGAAPRRPTPAINAIAGAAPPAGRDGASPEHVAAAPSGDVVAARKGGTQ